MAKKTQSPPETPDFEATLATLEQTVEQLENDELSLEAAMQAFEKGIKLARDAQKALAEAEQKVYLLTERDGEPAIEELERDGE